LPEPRLAELLETELNVESLILSPPRDISKEQVRLLDAWRGFDLTTPDPEVRFHLDTTFEENTMHLFLEDGGITARYGNKFLDILDQRSLVVVPSLNRKKNALSNENMAPNNDEICFVLVVEDDQLADYRDETNIRNLVWIVLPPGTHRGVLVSRQLTKICFVAMQADGLVQQENYLMVDDDIKLMEHREYRQVEDRYESLTRELDILGLVEHYQRLLDGDVTVKGLNDHRFHEVWVAIGSTPARDLRGKAQFSNMSKYDLTHCTRVSGVMCIHIERSAAIPFCPNEWLWYPIEKWNDLQEEREDSNAIQLIFFQGEDFRFCASACEKVVEPKKTRTLPCTYRNNKLVIKYFGKEMPSQARTINIPLAEQKRLVEEYWNDRLAEDC